ncbi:hypothetical protein ACFQZ4_21215 [Catellatospora coxensis]
MPVLLFFGGCTGEPYPAALYAGGWLGLYGGGGAGSGCTPGLRLVRVVRRGIAHAFFSWLRSLGGEAARRAGDPRCSLTRGW